MTGASPEDRDHDGYCDCPQCSGGDRSCLVWVAAGILGWVAVFLVYLAGRAAWDAVARWWGG